MAEIVSSAVGIPILGLAVVMLWRLYIEVRKDRDFWREQALKSTALADVGSKTAQALANPVHSDEEDRRARLKTAAAILAAELDKAVEG